MTTREEYMTPLVWIVTSNSRQELELAALSVVSVLILSGSLSGVSSQEEVDKLAVLKEREDLEVLMIYSKSSSNSFQWAESRNNKQEAVNQLEKQRVKM